MLHTANTTDSPGASKSIREEFYNFDSLIGELNQPKEVISGGTAPGSPAAPGNVPAYDEPADRVTIAPEVAALSGKMIAGTIDTGFSTVCSLYAKAPSAEKYEASPKQIEKLESAWTAVAQKYNYQVSDSPWFNLIILMIAVYFPIWKEAAKDHRFAEMDEKLEEMKRQIQENQARINLMSTTPSA